MFHATLRLEASLAHARMLLKPGGLFVLNEVTRVDDYLTVLFGVLPGWWRGEDRALRLPHSPLADCRVWERLLLRGGFARSESVGPGGDTPPEGNRQSLVLALADDPALAGVACRDQKDSPATSSAASQIAKSPATEVKHLARIADAQLEGRIVRVLAKALHLEETALGRDIPFVQFGIDSLVAIQVIQKLNKEFGIRVTKNGPL